MKTIRRSSSIIYVATIAVVMVALPARLAAQAVAAKSPDTSSGPATQWSVQVDRVNAGDQELAYSFQVAIYENLLEELNKTKQFKYVLREGDSKASELPDLLILKTTVVKYTRRSETQRAVTTVSGATKLTVRSQLITRDGKPVLDTRCRGTFASSAAICALPTIWPQYRQNDQAIGMARIRSAGAILTSRL